MEIVRPKDKSVEYESIKVGEVFCYEDCYFMKIDITDCSQYRTTFAVSLATGEHVSIKLRERVYPVRAKVTIEEE